MSRRRSWLAVVAALAVLVSGNWWLNRAYRPEPPAPDPVDERIDYALSEFRAAFFDADGELTLSVSGPRLTHDAITREARIDAPRFEIDPATSGWHGRADRGLVARDAERLVLTGDVELGRPHERGPVTIESDRIEYDRAAGTARSPGPARMQQGGTELTGGTLTVWIDEQRMELRPDAHAIYRRNDAAADR